VRGALASNPAELTIVPGPSTAPVADAPLDVMNDEVVARIRWTLHKGLGPVTLRQLIDRFGSARAALAVKGDRLPAKVKRARDAGETTRPLEEVLAAARRSGALATGYELPGFPRRLTHLHHPPPLLFLRGDPSLLDAPAVAVVGSRKATEYGRGMARSIGEGLARAGVAVVSGMALGIDGAAHRGALAAGGATTAVLGSGPDRAHPPSHRRLFEDILERGLVVSEFLPGEEPLPHHFPRRNRLIAALSKAVVVVEAARRSGALITVEHALEIGRDVLAVPGTVGRPQSEGVHALIRDGAGLVTSAHDILLETGFAGAFPEGRSRDRMPSGLDARQRALWDALEAEPGHIDTLARRARLEVATAAAILSVMEVHGWVRRVPGLRFARSPT
jgi:DNA processing protein